MVSSILVHAGDNGGDITAFGALALNLWLYGALVVAVVASLSMEVDERLNPKYHPNNTPSLVIGFFIGVFWPLLAGFCAAAGLYFGVLWLIQKAADVIAWVVQHR